MPFTIIHPTDLDEGVRGRISSPLFVTGKVPMQCGSHTRYEGLYERMFLETLDINPFIKSVRPQPLSFKFTEKTEGRDRYTPDFLVEYAPRGNCLPLRPLLVEVKTQEDLQNDRAYFVVGFKAAIEYCRSVNWRFRLVTDTFLSRPYAENARFLARYLRDSYDPDIATRLKSLLHERGPMALNRLLEIGFPNFEDRMYALSVAWHLLATRQFEASLLEPLNNSTLIWKGRHGKA